MFCLYIYSANEQNISYSPIAPMILNDNDNNNNNDDIMNVI